MNVSFDIELVTRGYRMIWWTILLGVFMAMMGFVLYLEPIINFIRTGRPVWHDIWVIQIGSAVPIDIGPAVIFGFGTLLASTSNGRRKSVMTLVRDQLESLFESLSQRDDAKIQAEYLELRKKYVRWLGHEWWLSLVKDLVNFIVALGFGFFAWISWRGEPDQENYLSWIFAGVMGYLLILTWVDYPGRRPR